MSDFWERSYLAALTGLCAHSGCAGDSFEITARARRIANDSERVAVIRNQGPDAQIRLRGDSLLTPSGGPQE